MTDQGGPPLGLSPVEPHLRGNPWPEVKGTPYPRLNPADLQNIPGDTWRAAQIPVGVRLELVGTAERVEVHYSCATEVLGYRGDGAGTTFSVWAEDTRVDEQPARLGSNTVTLYRGSEPAHTTIYLPEGMRPTLHGVQALDGEIRPAPTGPPWIAYGDSITEGWSASSPALNWVAITGRKLSLDFVNFGYAGSARGEVEVARQIAALPADLISIAFGTNCWSITPHTTEMIHARLYEFIAAIRGSRPLVPIVVLSPIVRPDAESTPNAVGATLSELRTAMEEAVAEFSDPAVTLLRGLDLLASDALADGIHPGDTGHAVLAEAVATMFRQVLTTGEARTV